MDLFITKYEKGWVSACSLTAEVNGEFLVFGFVSKARNLTNCRQLFLIQQPTAGTLHSGTIVKGTFSPLVLQFDNG